MSNMTPPRPIDELEWLSLKRKAARKQLEESKKLMRKTYEDLTATSSIPNSKWGRVMYFVDRAPSIYQGIRTGYKVASVFSAVVAFTRLFKKKK